MPRDEFERLERRWRERPLFLERPRRRPLWGLTLILISIGAFLAFVALAPPSSQWTQSFTATKTGTEHETQPVQTRGIPVHLNEVAASNGR